MAEGEVKISALPSGSSLTGVEKIPMVQGGITIEASAQEIADLSIPLINSKQDKPNGVLTGCTITLGSFPLGKNVRITEGTWRISPSEYGNVGSGDTDFLVALSASGLQRYVEIVGTNSNTIIKVEGAENAIAVRPTLGIGQVSLGSILVKDALIDPPVPDLSGYIPLTGTALMNGDIRRTQTSGDFNQVSFRPYSLSIENNNLITFGYKVELDLNIAQSSLIVSTPTTQRGVYIQANNKIAILDDIAIYSNLSHLQIATKLGAEPYGLITKQYADDNYGSGVTNLGYTASPTNGIVTSDTGTDATLTLVDGTNAGLVSPSMKSTWDNKQSTLTDVNFATFVNSTTNKTTPVDADIVPIVDVSTGKRFSLSNLFTNWFLPKIIATAFSTTAKWELKGVANNSSAPSGYVGEVLSSGGLYTGIGIATITTVGSLSLPAGDYDVESSVEIIFNSGVTGGTVATSISENATLNILGTVIIRYPYVAWSGTGARLQSGRIIVKKASTGNVYCCAYQEFGGGTCDVRWYITARRVR